MTRLSILFASFCITLGGLMALAVGLDWESSVERGRQLSAHRDQVQSLETQDRPLVIWLGDSTIVPVRNIDAIPNRIARQLRPHVETRVVSFLGGGFWEHYFSAGRVVDAEPTLVVLIANLRTLPPAAHLPSYLDLASELPGAELPNALSLPLHQIRMSLPRILLMRLLRVPVLEEIAYFATGLRDRVSQATRAFAPPPSVVDLNRPGIAERHFGYYDAPLHASQGSVQAMQATLALLERHGIASLVVVSPIPTDALQRAGLYDAATTTARVDRLRELAEAEGASVVDLHDLLAEDGFRDELGHFSETGSREVTRVVRNHVLRILVADENVELPSKLLRRLTQGPD
jgi:hypothetical protein